jgi:hypothetical protein
MDDQKKDAPSAAATALGADVEGHEATGHLDYYHSPRTPRKGLLVRAKGPDGQRFTVTGQTARTLLALVKAGAAGVTALEIASWAFRLSHYVMVLRHKHRLAIPMQWEAHECGKHGRYVLRSTVTIIEVISD